MTQRERERMRPELARIMDLVGRARGAIAGDEPNEAQELLANVQELLLELEGRVGCYTPHGLFAEGGA